MIKPNSTRQYDAFLFDLDGTLLDTADDLGAALNTVLKNNDMQVVPKHIYTPVASNGANGLLEAGYKALWPKQNQSLLRQQLLDAYADNIAVYTQCFKGVELLLEQLDHNGIKWGIMTNKPGFLTTPLVKAIPALRHAKVVVSGDTLAVAKPFPDPLLYCADLLQVEPKRCLYIGDAERDIQAGKAANMDTATALWGYIPSLSEALAWNATFNWQTPLDGINNI
ncbi:HAD-IA family hydrolase [Pseudoalteromonas sp. MMG010]|uniref:HAD family hydrolase n=1 Tax=Pseudoalteromonas sp. MMG010 TaxID=2822685 RepID=UPI001B3A4328|nr:HAD-IA family hydrolase [Pseudoalteromonas sp. MMG010]MBQ4832368.1 HAD-IA family hydrolase [Pseudoalteromonas sp. MMG010]